MNCSGTLAVFYFAKQLQFLNFILLLMTRMGFGKGATEMKKQSCLQLHACVLPVWCLVWARELSWIRAVSLALCPHTAAADKMVKHPSRLRTSQLSLALFSAPSLGKLHQWTGKGSDRSPSTHALWHQYKPASSGFSRLHGHSAQWFRADGWNCHPGYRSTTAIRSWYDFYNVSRCAWMFGVCVKDVTTSWCASGSAG